jgi:alkylation response protein AidB-like acyl-CoA dehydrogenase
VDFKLSEEHQAYADSVRRFARDKLADGALARAHSPEFPWATARLIAEQGLMGIAFPEADGGQGGTLMHAVLTIQEVALVCPKSADIVPAGNFGPIRTFVEYASAEQKARFLADLLGGRKLIALGMSEPDAGSAATELKTSARFDGDEVVINGFDVGAPSAFMSGETWSPLYFQNCRIPKANVLLGEGGFKKQISGFNVERLGNSSRALALGRHCFNLAREHALVRK